MRASIYYQLINHKKCTVFKSRLVCRGFNQVYGIDYLETYSPVANFRSIQILLTVAISKDYEIHQLDYDAAFLNASIKEEVYVTPVGNFDSRVLSRLQAKKDLVWPKAISARMVASSQVYPRKPRLEIHRLRSMYISSSNIWSNSWVPCSLCRWHYRRIPHHLLHDSIQDWTLQCFQVQRFRRNQLHSRCSSFSKSLKTRPQFEPIRSHSSLHWTFSYFNKVFYPQFLERSHSRATCGHGSHGLTFETVRVIVADIFLQGNK